MLALRACAWNASGDAVIDWLKNAPVAGPRAVLALERRLRRAGLREWRFIGPAHLGDGAGSQALLKQVNGWREAMSPARPLSQWLDSVRELLQATGQWTVLERDAAGAKVIAALRLDGPEQDELLQLPQAARRFSLAEFTAWADDTLEGASFVPEPSTHEQVVILPFNQLLGRPFAALVMAGCDEMQLAAGARAARHLDRGAAPGAGPALPGSAGGRNARRVAARAANAALRRAVAAQR